MTQMDNTPVKIDRDLMNSTPNLIKFDQNQAKSTKNNQNRL